jgi:ssDNA-binding Zn-finger/Zn-ribbon topoisomerase 1
MDIREQKIIPTQFEAETLLKAQGDFIKYGKTDIVCPRCGRVLVYENGSYWEVTRCSGNNCIKVQTRGI